ncbi:hypothetical protein G7B40_018155 [Aetokthonos hydrillicola Thurmond2011]|uniref:Uncharacterized protein n=1 Tax=Aetokthonos hydrillicola Thurmond2011 TaxID=2712845 RepID=A0AAP5I7K4_9CYAN|nr:hypothetical protein [Aetokthonos hydrillicola]MBO3460375.1 hypothetical protein [Aetokthonos hydrillicola CCALA 1050]MBW4584505.1 hypothetical protein [Aetokthonos hydrillicola CCALA 1050]MDR9896468.1 hypothetical protein [Aetokthonos hydrillicola Thurmond2011]
MNIQSLNMPIAAICAPRSSEAIPEQALSEETPLIIPQKTSESKIFVNLSRDSHLNPYANDWV